MTLVRGRLYAGNYQDSCRNHFNGVLQSGRETGFNSEYNKEKMVIHSQGAGSGVGMCSGQKIN